MPATYPRTYLPTRGWRIFFIGLALVCGVPCLIGLSYLVTTSQREASADRLLAGCLMLIVIGCIYLALIILRSRIVLYADRIEIHEITVARKIRRDEIATWRISHDSTPPMLILQRNQPAKRKVEAGLVYDLDHTFKTWLVGIPNGDMVEQRASVTEIEQDSQLGTSPHHRRAAVEQARRSCRILNVVAVALFFWGCRPRPYAPSIAALIAAPWLGTFIVWRSAGAIRMDEGQNDHRPSVALLMILSCAALALRATLDYETIGWHMQFTATFVIALLLFTAQLWADSALGAHRASAAAVFFLALIYGYGASIQINTLADSGDIHQHRYIAESKHVSTGKVTTHRVELRKVHAQAPEVTSAQASQFFYERLKPGDPVCLAIRPGALGIEWFSAGPCPPYIP